MTTNEDIDRSKLKYVLYARRSTTDEGSQVRSIPDQIKYCERHAEINGLNIVATFQENGSAKKPDKKIRPKFYEMLQEIENAGKYNAILAYAPDRLSRNMLDGGSVINMLDEHKIKDLQFPTHHFTNDPSGKLTLGIMFSISKHFSDDLSQKVRRGVSGNFDDGKSSGSPKWGYERDIQDGLYKPNEWFSTVQEAWYLRAKGATNKTVLDFLLENDYHRLTKITQKNNNHRKILPTEKSVGVMFKDPFYYGVLEQANQTIDLRPVYDFKPMIEENTYNQVQALTYTRKRDINPTKQFEFKPLARMVYCGVCKSDKWMLAGKNLPGGSKNHVLSYRCDNPDCTRSIKSIRAKFVIEAIYTLLDELELSDEAYERYSKRIDSFTDEKIINIKKDIASKRGAYAHNKKELDDLSLGLRNINRTSPAYAINEDRINIVAGVVQGLNNDIDDLQSKIANPNKIKLTKEQFLNLIKSAPNKMRAGSAIEKDRLARILFLNLRIDNEKRLSVIWKEPFASLINAIEMSSGADERT